MALRRALIIFLWTAAAASAGCSNNTAAAGPGNGGGGGRGRGGRGGGGDAPVVTTKVGERDVPIELAAIGNVEAFVSNSVRSQVTGTLVEVAFHEGDVVKQGQLLFQLDRRPFEAALAQAEANLTRDKALLAQAEAQLSRDASNAEYQQLTAERQAQLTQRGIISKDQADQARAAADATAGTVKADKANIESARAQLVAQDAAVANARVQLGYTTIQSPIDGQTGSLAVKVGGLVTANQTELMTIARVQPVYVTFTVPAIHLATIKRHKAEGVLAAIHLATIKRHKAEGVLPVTAVPQDGDPQGATGALAFVDNAVDMTTDTIKLKATFPNQDRRLWPGQFARVVLRLATLPHAVVVPQQAVQTGQDGQYVFVVKPDSTVEQRPVTPGQRVDQDLVIDKGLKPGEGVVTEGQLRLEQGTRVTTDTGAAPGAGRGRGGRGRGQGGSGRSGESAGSGRSGQ
jgi:multidrug efflux system membrane fusion protein